MLQTKNKSSRIVFGLGSNLGNKQQNICSAINWLQINLQLKNTKTSFFLINSPLLPANHSKEWELDFLNVAFSGDIDLLLFPMLSVLHICQSIEQQIGRNQQNSSYQQQKKWAPREIDIDILLLDNLHINYQNILQIPHYQLQNRSFFLETTKDIESELLEKNLTSTKRGI